MAGLWLIELAGRWLPVGHVPSTPAHESGDVAGALYCLECRNRVAPTLVTESRRALDA
jgi:hypothetical protein